MKKAPAKLAEPQQANDEQALLEAVEADQAARRAIPPELLERYHREVNERHEADPQVMKNREDARKAHEAIQAARAAGEPEIAMQRAQEACGRDDLNFDDRPRAAHHRRRVFQSVFGTRRRVGGLRASGATPVVVRRAESSGSPRTSASTRSSARSGDSGDDSDSDPEPPSRRLCAFCNGDVPASRSPKATHCTDQHAARDRQRRKRQRDRERSKLPPTPTTAGDRRYYEIPDEDRKRLLERVVCGCNGAHQEFEPGWCFRCGHLLPEEVLGGFGLYKAFVARLDPADKGSRVAA